MPGMQANLLQAKGMNDRIYIIIYSVGFAITLLLTSMNNFENWYVLFIYLALSPSLIDHIKQLNNNRLPKEQTRLK